MKSSDDNVLGHAFARGAAIGDPQNLTNDANADVTGRISIKVISWVLVGTCHIVLEDGPRCDVMKA